MSAIGPKRTSTSALHMSAFGVKRTTQANIYSGLVAKMFFRPSVAQCSERVFEFTGLVSSGPQHLCHSLQKLPAHHTVLLHERAEVPVSNPITDEFARCGDRRHARTFVYQSDLAEIVARIQGRALFAANKNCRLAGFNHKEGGTA